MFRAFLLANRFVRQRLDQTIESIPLVLVMGL
jgi:hypothetical protein